MKERITILFFTCLFFISYTSAVYSGVSPSSYEVNFEPNTKHEFSFSFVFEQGEDYEPYLSGSLSEYAKISKINKAFGRTIVVVEVNFPQTIDTPGLNILNVGAAEKLDDAGGVAITGSPVALIKIRVPYPGKYAEIKLETEYKNAGEQVPYILNVMSRGKEAITIKPKLEISNAKGTLDTMQLETKYIKSKEGYIYQGFLPTENYPPGDYNVSVIIPYGGERDGVGRSFFRLGELRVGIANTTTQVHENKVNRFGVEMESFWNNKIESIYGTIAIQGYPGKTVTTPTSYLNPWEKKYLIGFLDTTGIEDDTINVDITLFYAGNKTTTKTVQVEIVKSTNWLLIGLIVGGIAIGVLIIALIFIVFKLSRKVNNEKKKIKKTK